MIARSEKSSGSASRVERLGVDHQDVPIVAGPSAVLRPARLRRDVAVFHAADESDVEGELPGPGSAATRLRWG